ncbi:MAG: AIPR family protein [Bacteroidales bacterium]
MSEVDRLLNRAYTELKPRFGGNKADYLGLVYLEKELQVSREKALKQVAFGENDYGVGGFHFDLERKNLYIYQFIYSDSPRQFQPGFLKLIDRGIDVVFGNLPFDKNKDKLINQLRSTLIENRAVIRQVCVRFVFTGDPDEADKSQVLVSLREDLGNKKYIIDQFLGDDSITLVADFRSFDGQVGTTSDQRKSSVYQVPLAKSFSVDGPGYELMHIALMRLYDLYVIHQDLGNMFFEKNIRYGLDPDEYVNRAINNAFKSIALDEIDLPQVFAFNHNGITLAAESLSDAGQGQFRLVAPRLLNGAQTVTTLSNFVQNLGPKVDNNQVIERLKKIHILCKIITGAAPAFVTSVTINNNRQNPVKAWNLHAHDLIQLSLSDKFLDEVNIKYERQERAFENQEAEDGAGSAQERPVKMVQLAKTFLASDGQVQRMQNLSLVFEEDKYYEQVFSDARLKADARHIILAYKISFRLNKFAEEIKDKGVNKYFFVHQAKDLLWALLIQAVLNDEKLDDWAASYGIDMTLSVDYMSGLSTLATNRCRLLLSELIEHEKFAPKVAEQNFSFLKTNAAYDLCMEAAAQRWGWQKKRLR